MLVEAVGHLVEAEARVLEADLLADHVEGQRRQAAVHLAHDAGEDGAVAHAGVEQAHRRAAAGCRCASSMPTRRAIISFSLQVLTNSRYFWRLSKKRKLREGAPSAAARLRLQARRRRRDPQQRHQLARRGRRLDTLAGQECADALQGLRRDAGAVAQPRHELAVVDGAAPEGRLGHAGPPAELRNAVQQSDGCLCHRLEFLKVRCWRSFRTYGPCVWEDNHKGMLRRGGTNPNS